MKTIQDIDVEHAEEVTSEIVAETAKLLGTRRLEITETRVEGLTVPFALEI